MFPLRVAVETVRASHCPSCAQEGHVFIDTYAVISESTVLSSLVETVLSALGRPELALEARGLVQVNNWKALPFEEITDNMENTVESLFNGISSQITLRILTKPGTIDSASAQCLMDLKQQLLKTAVNENPSILDKIDNQQIKGLITQIIDGDEPTMLHHEQINTIKEWLKTLEHSEGRRSPLAQTHFHNHIEVPRLENWFKQDADPNGKKLMQYMRILNASNFRKNKNKISYTLIANWFLTRRAELNENIASLMSLNSLPTMVSSEFPPKIDFKSLVEDSIRATGGPECSSQEEANELHSNSDVVSDHVFKQESTPSAELFASTRFRFDPLTELPLLEEWFKVNPYPKWIKIEEYTTELNSRPLREHLPYISPDKVKNWFKNRRSRGNKPFC